MVSVSLHLATPWLVRAAAGLAPLHALSGLALTVTMTVLTLYPVASMWWGRQPVVDCRSDTGAGPAAGRPPDLTFGATIGLTLFRKLCYKDARDNENGFQNQHDPGRRRPGRRIGPRPGASGSRGSIFRDAGAGLAAGSATAIGAPGLAAVASLLPLVAPPPSAPEPQGPVIELSVRAGHAADGVAA